MGWRPRSSSGSLVMGGKRFDSSGAGLAGSAAFYCILIRIKSLAFTVAPAAFLPVGPLVPASDPRSPKGVSGSARPNPAPPKPTPGRHPPRASQPPPLPFTPTPPRLLRAKWLRNGSARAASAARAALATARGRQAKLRPVALGPARSCGEKRASSRRRRGGSRALAGRPHLPAWGQPVPSCLRGPQAEGPCPKKTGSLLGGPHLCHPYVLGSWLWTPSLKSADA
ncbi:uncharacterized protein WM277_024806 [Molossus nigricans]